MVLRNMSSCQEGLFGKNEDLVFCKSVVGFSLNLSICFLNSLDLLLNYRRPTNHLVKQQNFSINY